MLAIATQERGVHSSVTDPGGSTGLYQITDGVWVGYTIKAFNFETGKYDSVKITKEMIHDLDGNIQLAMMIFRECYNQMYGNIIAAIQNYNFGYGNMVKAIRYYCVSNGLEELDSNDMNSRSLTSVEKEIIMDYGNVFWTDPNYLKIVGEGDPYYLPNVMQYEKTNEFEIKIFNVDGTINTVNVRSGLEMSQDSGRGL